MNANQPTLTFGFSTPILTALCALMMTLSGCADPPEAADSGIMNKKTQEIGEFDAAGDDQIADLEVKPSLNPYAYATGSYGFAISEISKQAIQRGVGFFQAEHGRMPKDHDEFMTQIIEKYKIKLPVLPGNRRYQYDLEEHELVVVEAEKKKK